MQIKNCDVSNFTRLHVCYYCSSLCSLLLWIIIFVFVFLFFFVICVVLIVWLLLYTLRTVQINHHVLIITICVFNILAYIKLYMRSIDDRTLVHVFHHTHIYF